MPESYVACGVVWSDSDLLEIETHFYFDGWAGRERGYVTRDELRTFARSLEFVSNGGASARLDAGQPDLSSVSLEVFEYDRARRVGMHITLGRAAGTFTNRPSYAHELRMTIPIERGQLMQFSTDLRSAIQLERGEAYMLVPPDWP